MQLERQQGSQHGGLLYNTLFFSVSRQEGSAYFVRGNLLNRDYLYGQPGRRLHKTPPPTSIPLLTLFTPPSPPVAETAAGFRGDSQSDRVDYYPGRPHIPYAGNR